MFSNRKTATLNLRIDPALKAAAEQAANADRRSITGLIERLLTEHLRAIGRLPETVEGRRRGVDWARSADRHALQRVAEMLDPTNQWWHRDAKEAADHVCQVVLAQDHPDPRHKARFWDLDDPSQLSKLSFDYVRAFVDGAQSVWAKKVAGPDCSRGSA